MSGILVFSHHAWSVCNRPICLNGPLGFSDDYRVSSTIGDSETDDDLFFRVHFYSE